MNSDLTVEVSQGVAVLTINRPERLNAYTAEMGRLLGEAYRSCDSDDAVRAIVLTGAGTAFCAGADFSGDNPFASPGSEDFSASPVRPAAFEIRKPVIAAVNGHAIGIGLTIALQADIRVFAEDARCGVVQVRRGVIPDCMSHWTIPHLAGLAVAADLLLTGRTFLGQGGTGLGFAGRVAACARCGHAPSELHHREQRRGAWPRSSTGEPHGGRRRCRRSGPIFLRLSAIDLWTQYRWARWRPRGGSRRPTRARSPR